ncbi:MAG: hypothetical protein HQ510_00100 [Candidatus Marinimicrobia bacterium]|nr:hypothetical protein [Candidatus Neomarinimicrobiota bacterium]
MKKMSLLSVLGGLILLFSTCTVDSPLSDLPLTDPSLIQPVISLERERSSYGNLSHSATVYLYDKNHNSIELMDGHVTLNGSTLPVKHTSFFGAPYYDATGLIDEVELGVHYPFIIFLSDGEAYSAHITVQENDLHELTLPSTHNHTEDMPISWQDIDQNDPLTVYLSYQYNSESGNGSGTHQLSIPSHNLGTGNYSISAYELSNPEGIYHVTVKLSSQKTGTIDSHFRSGRIISSRVSISGSCNIE